MRSICVALLVFAGGCGSDKADGGADSGDDCTAELAALEEGLENALDAAAVDGSITSDPNFTLLLEADDGRQFSHSHGNSTETTLYESASTVKLVTAVVFLDLVDQGILSLDSKPSDLISFWVGETDVTLQHLLSFRSGFTDEPLCMKRGMANFESCVEKIYDDNIGLGIAPGDEFYYSGTHMNVAGLMAMKATGKSWTEIFDAWKLKTGLLPAGSYDIPSATNPLLAGGMHWTGREYLELLVALKAGTLLTPALLEALFANHRGSATVAQSPSIEGWNEDWAYGLGNWLECPTAMGVNTFDCGEGHRNSSAGAYGAYPFLDFDHGYVGLVARRGSPGTGREGLAIFREVEDLVTLWADMSCTR